TLGPGPAAQHERRTRVAGRDLILVARLIAPPPPRLYRPLGQRADSHASARRRAPRTPSLAARPADRAGLDAARRCVPRAGGALRAAAPLALRRVLHAHGPRRPARRPRARARDALLQRLPAPRDLDHAPLRAAARRARAREPRAAPRGGLARPL